MCCVAMELVAQLESREAELDLAWIPRGSNAEADRLTDGDCTGFRAENRRGASYAELKWLVLDELLDAGAHFLPGRA